MIDTRVMTVPSVGVHESIPFEIYHAWDCASNSRLSDLMRSAAYCRHRIDNPSKETDATKLGSAAHCAILEPEALEKRYVVAGPCEGKLKNGAACGKGGSIPARGKWYCRIKGHAPAEIPLDERIVLSSDQWDAARGIRDSVQGCVPAKALLERQVRLETSCAWKDPDTELLCKSRPDILASDLVGDVKTTRNAHPDKFEKHVAEYGIHRQAAFYMAGLQELGRKVEAFVVLAVEQEPPYECAVYAMDPQALRVGGRQVRDLMAQYRDCVKDNQWPGYLGGVLSVTLPLWYQKKYGFDEEGI